MEEGRGREEERGEEREEGEERGAGGTWGGGGGGGRGEIEREGGRAGVREMFDKFCLPKILSAYALLYLSLV